MDVFSPEMKAFLLILITLVLGLNAPVHAAIPDGSVSIPDTFFHVKSKGLTFDKGLFFDGRQNLVPLDTRFPRNDSMYFAPVLNGWEVVNGMVTMMWTMRILSSTGKLLHEAGTGNKTVERYPIAMVNDVPFLIELAKLKTADPYYTVEFSITDKVSSKGVEGSFRVLLE